MQESYGAPIERGRVMRKEDAGRYTVASIDRPGVVTLPLFAVQDDLQPGDLVLLCEFADGQGCILCKVREAEGRVGAPNLEAVGRKYRAPYPGGDS